MVILLVDVDCSYLSSIIFRIEEQGWLFSTFSLLPLLPVYNKNNKKYVFEI